MPRQVWDGACARALELGRDVVSDDLFLLALTGLDEAQPARRALELEGVDAQVLLAKIRTGGDRPADASTPLTFSPAYYSFHGRAQGFAAALGTGKITPEDVLLAMLWDPVSSSSQILWGLGVDREQLVERLRDLDVAVPAAPLPAQQPVEYGEKVWFERAEVGAVIEEIRLRVTPNTHWGFNYDGDRAGRSPRQALTWRHSLRTRSRHNPADAGAENLPIAPGLDQDRRNRSSPGPPTGTFALWVAAPDDPAVVKVANIQHLASPIRAQLREPVSAVELAGLLHINPTRPSRRSTAPRRCRPSTAPSRRRPGGCARPRGRRPPRSARRGDGGDVGAAGGLGVEHWQQRLAQLGQPRLEPLQQRLRRVVGGGQRGQGQPDFVAGAGDGDLGDLQRGGLEALPVRRCPALVGEREAAPTAISPAPAGTSGGSACAPETSARHCVATRRKRCGPWSPMACTQPSAAIAAPARSGCSNRK